MKSLYALSLALLLLSGFARAESPPETSLFFTPEETRVAEKLAFKNAPMGQGDLRLGAIFYSDPNDWTLWLQGERWTPETRRSDLRILSVTPDTVRLRWQGEDKGGDGGTKVDKDITLHPNQIYEIGSGRIVAAP